MTTTRSAGRVPALLVLWGVGSPLLLLLGLRDLISFGDVEPSNRVRGGCFLLACAFLLIVAPLTAAVLAARAGRNIHAVVSAVLALGGLVVGGIIGVVGLQEVGLLRSSPAPAPPVNPSQPTQCVELSGGDTRCPGG
ncbi:hypothetical protein [Actinoplanes regularis]|uniref:hypothetical protein n=1 Tax=Actinoplanes regularis TaxID=52697 RepID=UPI0011775D4F|nr:hypothetical protein [Actinoplanes regularis]